MKKTTWAIIGLSICVVVLAAALGVVLLQNKAETIFVREIEGDSSSDISEALQKKIDSFYIAPLRSSIFARYFNAEAYIKSHSNRMIVIPGNKNYQWVRATSYEVPKKK